MAMSLKRFEDDADKENVTFASNILNKGGMLENSGLIGDSWKLQPTAASKTLFDVISESPNRAAFRGQWGKQLIVNKTGVFSSTKNQQRILTEAENVPVNINNSEQNSKSQFFHTGQKVLKDVESHIFKTQPVATEYKSQALPTLETEVDNEDCDSVFPKSERLSFYVSKLLTWRPPCLFGIHPDSDPDNSDHEELFNDIELDMPLFIPTVPDRQLSYLKNDFTPPTPECMDLEAGAYQSKDIEMSFDLTSDASFSFGTLHLQCESLNSSQISDVNISCDLDRSAS